MQKKVITVLSYVLVALLSCAVTLGVTVVGDRQGQSDPQKNNKLQELQALIDRVFIGEVDDVLLQDEAAEAMIQALGDRWSYYMTQQEYKDYQDKMANSYVGIGITVQLQADGSGIRVTKVTNGSPAQEVGIHADDVVIAVEGQSIANMTLAQITPLIKGEAGTKVQLTVLRDGQELEMTVERRKIQTPVATGKLLEGNIGLVQIVNFDSRCADETMAVVNDLLEQGAEKLIFDVRNNPGGYKSQLVKLLDQLLPQGLLFRSEYYDGTVLDDHSDAACLDVPMAVLVNGSSYSAAEFFAAALREYDWATVVGTQTCGKGYFQNVFPLGDGSAAAISTGKYYTPKGVSLAEVGGLTPDHVVEIDEKTAAAIASGILDPMEDPQILAAIDALKGE